MTHAAPATSGPIHFVGIGGIGMSGIAEILHNLGFTVQGSDMGESANVHRLRALGIAGGDRPCGREPGQARVVVVSLRDPAPTIPSCVAARARRVPVVRRADMLAELMRLKRSIAVAGTHGKTTTTAIMAALLDGADLDPTVINGGIINAYGTNARLGQGEWMVVEADESDGSFLRLPATVAVVTNIDPEHMEFYGNFQAVRDAFASFVERLPFYGFAALCIDHPEVQACSAASPTAASSPTASARRPTSAPSTAGRGRRRDVRRRASAARTARGAPPAPRSTSRCPAATTSRTRWRPSSSRASSASPTRSSAARSRASAASSAASPAPARSTASRIIDDYGHHPVEIRAVLRTARDRTEGRVIAVVQPHRYTRLASLFDEFCTASTTPTRCWSPRSTPPARRRSRASTATRWSRVSAATATATCGRSTGRRTWRR